MKRSEKKTLIGERIEIFVVECRKNTLSRNDAKKVSSIFRRSENILTNLTNYIQNQRR